MKLVRIGDAGHETPCVLIEEDRAIDVSTLVGDFDGSFFANDGPRQLADALSSQNHLPVIEISGQRIGPCIARPGKIVCVGLNYLEHAEEASMVVDEEPILFLKGPNTVVGPNDDLMLPVGGLKTDWEVEMGVVIAKTTRYLPTDESARDVIAGYCVSNDVSERAFQLERGGQWDKGKSCETFNPLGPWLVTPNDGLDFDDLELTLSVNGERLQTGNTAQMRFGVATLIRYVSQFMVLEPGDLVNTGTPPGTGMGMTPPRFLRVGDVVETAIQGLGAQRQACRQAIATEPVADTETAGAGRP